MHNRHVHIICLDVPYPPNYGGVFDLYYKLPLLKAAGIHVHLHCFEYGRGVQPSLEEHCDKVTYYSRNKGLLSFLTPYIVSSRKNKLLLKNLTTDNYPVLMEGVHTSYFAPHLKNKKIVLRLHNAEYAYYKQLYINSNSFFKKIYYRIESALLKKYEVKLVTLVNTIAYVSESDAALYRTFTPIKKLQYLPVFLPWTTVTAHTGTGTFALYQGNLEVAENDKAAQWIITTLHSCTTMPIIIAGKNPSQQLLQMAKQYHHISVLCNPSDETMNDLMKDAHMHLLPSFSETGIKLKLLHALYTGRHCIVNKKMLAGTDFAPLCSIANTTDEWISTFNTLRTMPFTSENIIKREEVLGQVFNQQQQTNKLITLLFN